MLILNNCAISSEFLLLMTTTQFNTHKLIQGLEFVKKIIENED